MSAGYVRNDHGPSDERRRLPLASRRPVSLDANARAVDRTWRPRYCVWELTLRCDLACRHCGSRAGRARADELTTAEAMHLVDQLADLGVLEVTLFGGEVYLRDDWLDVIRAIRRRGMECTIVTGGRGLDRDRVRAARDAGVMSVSISIDGTEPTHDALRGLHGSHEAAMRAMHTLADEGVQVSANTQIGRRNRRVLEDVFVAIRDAGAHSWQLQLTVAAGRAADAPSLLLEPFHMIEVMPSVARIRARAEEADLRLWPGNNLGYYGPYEHLLRGNLPGGRRGSCGAGRSIVGIESDGAVKACPSLPSGEYIGGSVRDHALQDIWERAAELRFMRDAQPSALWGHCAECYYADDCLGGCSWTAHALFGRRGNNPFCHHRALELLKRGRRERLVRVEEAPGESFDHGRFEIVEEPWPDVELERARAVAEELEPWLLDV
jgi:radical SAM protein with 4Fe4S-binding SPASM domain